MENIQEEKITLTKAELEERLGKRRAESLIATLTLSPKSSWREDGVITHLRNHQEEDKYVFWQEESDGNHPWEE